MINVDVIVMMDVLMFVLGNLDSIVDFNFANRNDRLRVWRDLIKISLDDFFLANWDQGPGGNVVMFVVPGQLSVALTGSIDVGLTIFVIMLVVSRSTVIPVSVLNGNVDRPPTSVVSLVSRRHCLLFFGMW